MGYETKDANTYASWGVDFLKYDNCNTDGSKPEARYPVMRDALNATGRPIFYSLCGMFREYERDELLIFLLMYSAQNGASIHLPYGQQMLAIVGEQPVTSQILGIQ